jgi:capsular polysaccharide biosynthesis protein/GGDEF domain-containing protein
MELKAYLRILLKYWWLVVLSLVVTIVATLIFTSRQPQIYETKATFVIRPHSLIVEDEFVRTLDTLSRRIEINSTFAEIAGSKLIKEQAAEKLNLDSAQKKDLTVKGSVLAGTNILEIAVEGTDPALIQDFTEAVSIETLDYVNNLYDVLELEPLDPAEIPSKPIKPNLTFNLILGTVLGLGLGIALAIFTEYLNAPAAEPAKFDILDSESGLYNRPYFEMRARQEMSRARRHDYPLSMALVRFHTEGSNPVDFDSDNMRYFASRLGPLMREEDVLARYDDNTLVLLFPDLSKEATQTFVNEVQAKLGTSPLDVATNNGLTGTRLLAGIAEMQDQDMGMYELLGDAMGRLLSLEDSMAEAKRTSSDPKANGYHGEESRQMAS